MVGRGGVAAKRPSAAGGRPVRKELSQEQVPTTDLLCWSHSEKLSFLSILHTHVMTMMVDTGGGDQGSIQSL
jgi:hypothetical protein